MVTMTNDSEIQPYTFVLEKSKLASGGTAQLELAASGRHPKCKMVSGQVLSLIYSTSADTVAIEHEDGGDVATATQSTTIGTPATLVIAPAAGYSAVFERNEPIIAKVTENNTANTYQIMVVFETVP